MKENDGRLRFLEESKSIGSSGIQLVRRHVRQDFVLSIKSSTWDLDAISAIDVTGCWFLQSNCSWTWTIIARNRKDSRHQYWRDVLIRVSWKIWKIIVAKFSFAFIVTSTCAGIIVDTRKEEVHNSWKTISTQHDTYFLYLVRPRVDKRFAAQILAARKSRTTSSSTQHDGAQNS